MAGSPESAASVRGEHSVSGCAFGLGFAPLSRRSLTTATLPGLRAATIRGVRMSFDRALTSAWWRSSSARFGEIGGGPHQRAGACVVLGVGIGALLKERLDSVGRAVNHRVHEGRRPLGAASVEELRIGRDLFIQGGKVAAAKTFHNRDSLGVQRGPLGFV